MIGPALPPHLQAQRDEEQWHNAEPLRETQATIGPVLPDSYSAAQEEGVEDAIARFEERRRRIEERHASEQDKSGERPEWMLAPPKAGSGSALGFLAGGGKLKNRTFQTGRGARLSGDPSIAQSSLWTETPEQRQARIRDEEMGVRAKTLAEDDPAQAGRRAADLLGRAEEPDEESSREMRRQIEMYNEKYRGQSLVQKHESEQADKSDSHRSRHEKTHHGQRRRRSHSRSPDREHGSSRHPRSGDSSSKRHSQHSHRHEKDRRVVSPRADVVDPQDPSSRYTSKVDRKLDNPSARSFDYERDVLGSTKRMSMGQRDQMIAKSMDLGGRFSRSKFL